MVEGITLHGNAIGLPLDSEALFPVLVALAPAVEPSEQKRKFVEIGTGLLDALNGIVAMEKTLEEPLADIISVGCEGIVADEIRTFGPLDVPRMATEQLEDAATCDAEPCPGPSCNCER